MEREAIIVVAIFLILGGLNVIRPSFLLAFQIWVQRVVMKAEYIPSRRTYIRIRILGAFLIFIALLALSGVLEIK
ncbi:MAG: hypothetical protein QGH85_00535 [Candidatus Pacebacteria bacterium]|jgi:hypothetical protein|nr:hypothetical protein [Candidatus Paceibacterota bacterium]MDP7159060.1 hypothetical protein [Candidatus Paceibacterota bacterium]MDP7466110.1 hypothetical protein [Candidatus Paceibacterota bacterium]MDP7648192.1 hypothetical protein [Candidatus Paceibacterota bacterium]|tara:strand:- start:28744 stop:28968 length:225 start_codon:yes stop_codon:yes gene_type:complete